MNAQQIQGQEESNASELSTAADSVEALTATLRQEVKSQRKSLFWGLPGLAYITLIMGALISGLEHYLGQEQQILVSMIFLFCFCLATAGFGYVALSPRRRRRKLAATLVSKKDLRSIGPLVDTLSMEDGRMHEIAIEGLIPLLPTLKASDAGLLTPAQRTILINLLNLSAEQPLLSTVGYIFRRANDTDIQFRVAILQAFEQVGDAKAIPVVTRLATGKAKTPGQQRIQEAAQACLPALQLRADQIQSSQTLLRASYAANASPETLLRAAEGFTETSPEQLLRPGYPAP